MLRASAAAGAFGEPQHVEEDRFEWVAVESGHRLREGMFVTQVVGRSMEPTIPDGAWCLFRAPVAGTRQGKTVLVQLRENAEAYLDTVERAELSDAFWNVGLPLQMDTSVSSSPYFNVFLASQVKGNDKGFLASDHTVQNLLEGFSHTWLSGTSHPQHIFESYGVSARMGHPAMGASRMPISCALIWRLTAYPKVWMKLGSMTTTGFCSGAGALWPRRSGTTTRDCKGRHRRPRRRLRLTCADLPTANTATP